MKSSPLQVSTIKPMRVWLVMLIAGCVVLMLLWRIIELQVEHSAILQDKADARQQRIVEVNANRGAIYDRNGHILAVSTPVDSVWLNPSLFLERAENLRILAEAMQLDAKDLQLKLQNNKHKTFVYVQRHMPPAEAKVILDLALPGVYTEREYKRFYPLGEVTSHLLGFTNIDDQGQEGVELAYDHWLEGRPGKKRILRDRLGRTIEDIGYVHMEKAGKDLTLSIDKRIQYIAYRELKKAVQAHQAQSGSVVVLDATTGEVMALANQPAFNPNNRSELLPQVIRNRAIIDMFEPGSTMKTFTVAAALQSGRYNVNSVIETSPGELSIGEYTIRDARNFGDLDLASILVKSSNVGVSKIALDMPSEALWELLHNLGFGKQTNIGYPGEQSGVLNHYNRWSVAGKAALSYGYGIGTTTLQLAHAYAALANDGVQLPLTLQKQTQRQAGKRVLTTSVARQVKSMLKDIVSVEGTAIKASVLGYQVGGKTGTVKVSEEGGYAEDKYIALFAGMVPIENPKYVVVIVINEPTQDAFYGGQVAAPIFANIMTDSLRFTNIVPDDLPNKNKLSAQQEAVIEVNGDG